MEPSGASLTHGGCAVLYGHQTLVQSSWSSTLFNELFKHMLVLTLPNYPTTSRSIRPPDPTRAPTQMTRYLLILLSLVFFFADLINTLGPSTDSIHSAAHALIRLALWFTPSLPVHSPTNHTHPSDTSNALSPASALQRLHPQVRAFV